MEPKFYSKFPVNLPPYENLPDIDLYMDQVISIIEKYFQALQDDSTKIITPSMVNNYVKIKAIPAPEKKRYKRRHLVYLLVICTLKQIMPIAQIKELIDCECAKLGEERFYEQFREMFTRCAEAVYAVNSNHIQSQSREMCDYSFVTLQSAVKARVWLLLTQELFSKSEKISKKDNSGSAKQEKSK